jgi:2-succinyl-5-enolpyruvyl-6-hydroxy-3-cyclohexene-1-carboxylate synthase
VTLPADVQATFCATLVDEWFRGGVRRAVVCPGSRSTPLALALVAHPGIEVSVRLDERGAGFHALGMALWSGRPVVVLTTSGTAAAELHAAVVEAHQGRVPLVVCTADRPAELHHVGAPQTIEQQGLFGSAVRIGLEPGVPDEAVAGSWRPLGSRLIAEALHGPLGPGPVHLNLPFREPLVGTPGALPAGRPDERPWHEVSNHRRPAPHLVDSLVRLLASRPRGLLLAGGGAGSADPRLVLELATRLGWPVLADPRARLPKDRLVVGAADTLLRIGDFACSCTPDVVVRLGALPSSKVLAGWLASTAAAGTRHVGVDPFWAWPDPGSERDEVFVAEPDALLAAVLDQLGQGEAGDDAGAWAAGWERAETAAQGAIDAVLAGYEAPTEPAVARLLYSLVEADAGIVVSSSMPIRELEWFARPRPAPPAVLANRGANGIDGVVSTLFGVSAVAGGRTYGLVGDLAVLHDASALVRSAVGDGGGGRFRCVVVDNAGGGIFSFLPQAEALDEVTFEMLFGTPQVPAVGDLVRACGYSCSEPTSMDGVAGAVREEGSGFVVVKTDRRANVAVHTEIAAAVAEAVRS